MDDRNVCFRLIDICDEVVQIPLWTIGTLIADNRLQDETDVQIPLWTIGTGLCVRSSDHESRFRFLYGR